MVQKPLKTKHFLARFVVNLWAWLSWEENMKRKALVFLRGVFEKRAVFLKDANRILLGCF